MLDEETARERVLEAAEALFYNQGIQAVGMDTIRSNSGVSLKRLYHLFPSKADLVQEFLRERDGRWLEALAKYVETTQDPDDRVVAVFDWLYIWFCEPGYRGCAFINSFGELGAVSPEVAELARAHKTAFHDYLAKLVTAAGRPARLADHLLLLAEGAIVAAAIFATPEAAHHAQEAARVLMGRA